MEFDNAFDVPLPPAEAWTWLLDIERIATCFQAAAKMIPGDLESWHREWLHIAERNWHRGVEEEQAGHIRTAMNCWLRAADYYRQAEFYLPPHDPRRLATFE